MVREEYIFKGEEGEGIAADVYSPKVDSATIFSVHSRAMAGLLLIWGVVG